MKKKIFAVIMALIMMLSLCSCTTNEDWGFGNYEYYHVHISDGAEGHCATVTSWHDNEMGVELHTKEFGDVYCSEGTYFLFGEASRCPFC
jgi:hypothetical protein